HSTTKKPLARFFIGSFCETLLFQSPISLLILNPHAPAPKRIQNIFFPSDLSNQSLKLFRKVLFRANKLQAKVTLYHKLADDSLIWDKKTKEKCLNSPEVKKFKKWADKFEVPLNVVVEKHPDHLTQRILKLSRKSHQLIALTTHTGRIGSFFVGSTPRQVVRMTTLPVWLIH
ncbi:MAG: universal stress protein, partial [Bdellovibrio sp.]